MKIIKYIILILVIFLISLFVLSRVPAIQDRVVTNVIKNVLSNPVSLPDDGLSALVCGSRSPLPSPGRAETCIIIKAGQNMYVVDVGDGSISNLRNWGVDLTPVKAVLFTHLHSDHISDLADLHLNTWVNNPTKSEKLKVYGPEGVEDVVNGFEDAYKLDYQFRNEHHGNKVAPLNFAGYETFTIDLSNPIIIDDNGLKVTAFKVIHDPIEPALGFRFEYKGRSIVISGDTISTENTIKNSKNADVQNINYVGGAGSTTAAQFLQRFIINKTPWAHLDIAGMAFSKYGGALNSGGATGFGVRLLNKLIEDDYE